MRLSAVIAPSAALALLCAGSAAMAGPLPPAANAAQVNAGFQALRDYNLIVLKDLSSTSEVEGRTFVGGNLSGGASNYDLKNVGPSKPGLVVAGDTTGGKKNLNGGAGAEVGGKVDSGVEFNHAPQTLTYGVSVSNTNVNGNTLVHDTALGAALAAQAQDYTTDLQALSGYLAGLATTDAFIPPSNANNNFVEFSPTSGGDVAVYSLAQLTGTTAPFQNHDMKFNVGGYDLVVINVGGTSVSIPNSTHFNNGSGLGTKVIWNFYQATSITFGDQFDGTVLAPFAAAQNSNFIQGTAVFKSFDQRGEVHMDNYAGTLTVPGVAPEPAAWALMILGFGAAGAMLRRSQPAAAV